MIYIIYYILYDMIYNIWYIWYDMIRYDMIYDIWHMIWYMIWFIYLLTAVGLSPGGSSTVHIYTQIVHRTTQSTQTIFSNRGRRRTDALTLVTSIPLFLYCLKPEDRGNRRLLNTNNPPPPFPNSTWPYIQ